MDQLGKIISLKKIVDPRGNLTVVEQCKDVHFLDDGFRKASYLLNHPWEGLLIEPGIWRTLDDFSSGAVCMVLADELYDESDYIYDYQDFLTYKANNP